MRCGLPRIGPVYPHFVDLVGIVAEIFDVP